MPLPIIGLIARGCEVELSGESMAFHLPDNLGQLGESVQQLDLSGASLVGALPASIARLTRLRRLELSSNDGLEGAMPLGIGLLKLGGCKVIFGGNQQFSLADDTSAIAEADALDFSSMHLKGPLPPSITKLTNLTSLSMRNNKLSGGIPSELGGLSRLEKLGLSENELRGAIPARLGALGRLRSLNLRHNRLTGAIPVEAFAGLASLRGATSAQTVSKARCRHGCLHPSRCWCWASPSRDANRFEGGIPAEWGLLGQLGEPKCVACGLSGELPAELGGLARLKQCELGDNERGSAPRVARCTELLEFLGLDDNRFEGELPTTPRTWSSFARGLNGNQFVDLEQRPSARCAAAQCEISRESGRRGDRIGWMSRGACYPAFRAGRDRARGMGDSAARGRPRYLRVLCLGGLGVGHSGTPQATPRPLDSG